MPAIHLDGATAPLSAKTPVLLYGAGAFGARLAAHLRNLGHEVAGFVDLQASRTELLGLPVHRDPAQLSPSERTLPLILSIFNREVQHAPRKAQLTALGFDTVLGFAELPDPYRPDSFWLAPRAFYTGHQREIDALGALLEDTASHTALASLLRLRMTGTDAEMISEDRQYFIDGFLPPASKLRWLDCGAYNGDTIAYAMKMGHQVDAVAAFEPDPANFAALARTMDKLGNAIGSAALYPCGVYSNNEILRFASGAGEASALGEGSTQVQCVSLDSTVAWLKPNFIKMDIEGAEMDALSGARNILRQQRPYLAISIYHRPADLWQIPLLIREIEPSYRFMLRTHGMFGFDTVLYAIPATR